MINELREKIIEYVSKNADVNEWKNIRELFGLYSYLMFLFMITKALENTDTLSDMHLVAANNNLEDNEVIIEVVKLPCSEEFISDINHILDKYDSFNVPQLYQEYIAIDFVLAGKRIKFESGKNGRDVLGSYYTNDDFAEIITAKAVEDYLKVNDINQLTTLKIADYSCGGAAFLKSALRICVEKHIPVELYGYDVDPIAVIISRYIMISEYPFAKDRIFITLGNPLLTGEADCVNRFTMAIQGRYYNDQMGIEVENNMDIVLGNPPWEKIRFEEKKFLHHFVPDQELGVKSDREKVLVSVSSRNREYYQSIVEDYEMSKKQIKKSPIFVFSNCGELNTYALFTELSRTMIKEKGIVSLIVKSSLFKMPVYSSFFKELTQNGSLYELYMFVNREKIFNIDSREEFSVLYITKGPHNVLKVALNLSEYKDFVKHETLQVSYDELNKLNPETGMIPSIKNSSELKFLLSMANSHKTFGEIYNQCRFGRLVHLTNHSAYIKKQKEDGFIAIYEGKFIEQYTAKFATFAGMSDKDKYKNKATAIGIENPHGSEYPVSRFFIKDDAWKNISRNFGQGYVVAWRSLTAATNRRTMLATILPLVPTCQSIQLLQMDDLYQMMIVLALFNSIVFDYMVRLKMVGLDLTQTIIRQIPVPEIEKYEEVVEFKGIETKLSVHLLSRVKKLYEDDNRVIGLFKQIDLYEVNDNRNTLIADIDKLIAIAYEIPQNELRNIALSFDLFYTKEEVEALY